MSDLIQLININPDQFKEQLAIAVKNELASVLAKFEPNHPERLLTRKETAKFFSCSLLTIDKWSSQGKIQPYQMGSLIYFKYSELMDALQTLQRRKSA